jgi:diadenylate cyclase
LELLPFIEFKITDIIDIVLVALLLFYVYKLVRGTVAINIFIGIVIVWVIWRLTDLLEIKMINSIVGGFMNIGLIALIIVFQQEIRKFLLMLGSTSFSNKWIIKNFKFVKQPHHNSSNDVKTILAACYKLAETKTGVLLVIERDNSLDFVANSGDKMNIEVSQPIIESIFYKNSPLHDGAAIIVDNYIIATRVILPVSDQRSIPQRFGLRHRAAVGITEKTDALALVVSEESGLISYIKNGEFVLFNDRLDLERILNEDLL